MKLFVMTALGALALTGCATMSKSECASADWYTIGEVDGRSGQALEFANDRAEACFKHKVPMDMDAYRSGRTAGLSVYCAPDKAFTKGRSGNTYSGVCEGPGEAAFLAQYELGKEGYRLQQDVNAARAAYADAEQEIDDSDARIAEIREILYEDGDLLTREEIGELNDESNTLVERRTALVTVELPILSNEISEREAALDIYEATVERRRTGLPAAL